MLTSHYTLLLSIHGLLRWVVLLSGASALGVYLSGFSGSKPFAPAGRLSSLVFVSLMDTQILVGILLSFGSPLTNAFWANPGAGMKVHDLRYFAIEHTSTMLVALVLAHIGSIRSRKVSLPSRTAYLRAFRWHTASLVLILLGVPWWRLAIRQ